MADDSHGTPADEQIDLSDPDEIKRWRRTFGVTEEELRAAVQKAGTSPDKVREALRARA